MTGIHAACAGCSEIIPATPGQLFGMLLAVGLTIALFGVVLLALSRYNR